MDEYWGVQVQLHQIDDCHETQQSCLKQEDLMVSELFPGFV